MIVTFHDQVFIHNAYILKIEKILWVAIKDNFLRIVIKKCDSWRFVFVRKMQIISTEYFKMLKKPTL